MSSSGTVSSFARASNVAISAVRASTVRSGIASWWTSGSASKAATTAGSRLSAVASIAVARGGASIGASRIRPSSGRRSASAIASAPPMPCPSRNTGTSGRSARAASIVVPRSAAAASASSISARSPPERPCPRWSGAMTP